MGDDDEEEKIVPQINHRNRAFSVCSAQKLKKRTTSSATLQRTHSDSNLSHIDKEKTFAFQNRRPSAMPSDLLAKVVVALGGYRIDNDEQKRASVYSSSLGIHGFSDSQILASEQNFDSNWSIGASERSSVAPTTQQNHRLRARSEIRIPMEQSVKVANMTFH